MPFEEMIIDGYVIQSEHLQSALRAFKAGSREFDCLLISTGPESARLLCGKGGVTPKLLKAISKWIRSNGYTSFTYERACKREKGKLHIKAYSLIRGRWCLVTNKNEG